MKRFRIVVLCALLLHLFLPVLPTSAQTNTPSLAEKGAAQLENCFDLSPAMAEAILDEPVDPTWSVDEQYGYCTYASVSKGGAQSSADLLPTYGPIRQHQYVAATVWPTGSATDPFMYIAFAILDRNHSKFGDFLSKQGMTALEELSQVESAAPGLSRQFLPDLGDGALWYWQETGNGQHLAGIYALKRDQRVSVQALVSPERSEEAVLDTMSLAVESLIAANVPAVAPAPIVVDGCPFFTPFDAGAILQEPVNAEEPVGNLLFGPLPTWATEEGADEVVDGICGFTNVTATVPDTSQSTQTYLATPMQANHAVVASHLTGEIAHSTSGTFSTDWFDLILLVNVVGAAHPEEAQANFDALYAAFASSDVTGVLPALYQNAQADPSFSARRMPLAKDAPQDEMLWLWQTVDDGYFSLLISRQGTDFDLIAARLGSGVTEKTVLGYSQVVLEKLNDGNALGSTGDGSVPGCDHLSLNTVAEIVGEPVQGQAVTSVQGSGCKYTPVEDNLTIDSADFSSQFQTFGVLAGVVPSKAAQLLLYGMIQELSTDGNVADGDALGDLLAAIKDEDFATALPGMADLEWNSNRWQVEPLTEESTETVLLSGESGNGWPQFFLLQNRAEGGVYYLTGVIRLDMEEARPAIVAAASQLAAPPTITEGDTQTSVAGSAESPVILGCDWMTADQASEILGIAVRGRMVLGERGDGCKYAPASELARVASDDFSPNFETFGVLAGSMPLDAAQWLLEQLNKDLTLDQKAHAALTAAIGQGNIADALASVASQKLTTSDWQIRSVGSDGLDVLWLHNQVEDGTHLSFFLLAQTNEQAAMLGAGAPGMWIIAVQLPADGDLNAMRDAALAALAVLPTGSASD